jgi:ABC-type lipoprotein release transport system permease subunit
VNLPFLFARRYLLAKRSTNAINVITLISIVVIAVVTAAMVVVLSALNGINDLVDTLYSPFDQDLSITAAEGKTFERSALPLDSILRLPAVADASWTIEENVLLRSGDQQAVATMKGVEPQYLAMSRMPEYLYSGEPRLEGRSGPLAILGIGLKVDLDVPLDDGITRPLEISAPVRGRKLSRDKQGAFETSAMAVGGAFSMNMEFDTRYALVPLDLAASLLHYDSAVSALELQTQPGTDLEKLATALSNRLGPTFTVRTRYQKNALMYRTNATEKKVTFLLLTFIGLIGAFNIIASLTMMMIEKKADMRTLMGMGATDTLVRRIFLYEGLLIVATGVIAGLVIGGAICWAQMRFGLVPMEGTMVDAFPVKVLWTDLVIVVITVFTIGLVSTRVPLRSLSRRFLHATAAKA